MNPVLPLRATTLAFDIEGGAANVVKKGYWHGDMPRY
tara:strand:- start:284 stop:394 length:111 start_codon:yes stop_codon:yes gene_type:complete